MGETHSRTAYVGRREGSHKTTEGRRRAGIPPGGNRKSEPMLKEVGFGRGPKLFRSSARLMDITLLFPRISGAIFKLDSCFVFFSVTCSTANGSDRGHVLHKKREKKGKKDKEKKKSRE